MKRINLKYLQIWKEIPFFIAIIVNSWFKEKETDKGKILIVDSCLLGEFTTSLPAVSYFIKNNPNKTVDLIVSPSLQSLAKKIKGIRKVYTTFSSYGKKWEIESNQNNQFDSYEKVIVLRASPDIYKTLKNMRTGKVETALLPFIRYSLHLTKNLILKRTPKSWRELSFEMFKLSPQEISFEEIFVFTKEDYDQANKLIEPYKNLTKIVIHTGSHWSMNHWDPKKWVELLEKINKRYKYIFLFIGNTKKDLEDYDYISANLSFKTHSFINQLNIDESILLLRLSDYFIGIDSGPMNMAHLADIRSINILGPGPHMYMPWNNNDVILDKSAGRGLFQRFIEVKKPFIAKITTEEVYEAFQRISSHS